VWRYKMKIKDFLDLPEWSSDAVHIDLTIHWGYLDRFKIFLFATTRGSAKKF